MIIKKKTSIREQVYDYLKGEIVNGRIKEETRIVEEEYAEKLNISRTPIREALRMLEFEGFVEAREKGGVTVPRATKKDVEEVIKIRIALETVILEEVFECVTPEDIQNLENNLKYVDTIVQDDKNSSEVFKYFSEFNKTLYEISNLPRVVALINNLNLYLKRFRKISANNTTRRLNAHKDHLEIVKYIKENNKEEALRVNKRHLAEAKEFLLREVVEND